MTRSYRFLTSGRWVGLIVTGLVVAATCVLLGFWQWGRYEHKRDLVAQFDRAYDAPVQTMAEVVDGGIAVSRDREWYPVELTGRWVSGEQVLVRNRTVDGRNAYRVIGLFRADAGHSPVDVLVDRGWLPVADDQKQAPELEPGPVSVVARLREPEAPDARGIAKLQAQTINPEQVGAALARGAGASTGTDVPLVAGYAQVTDGMDGLSGYPRPERDLGPHLSYAFQWWVFAVGIAGGLVVLARREAAENAGVTPARSRVQHATAETEEDALLDQQLSARR